MLYVVGDIYEGFKGWWNSLGKRELVIIDSHADPISFASTNGTEIILTKDILDDTFDKVNVKMLVLLGCNAGHYSYTESMARAFANKITGKVLASDGTVVGSWYDYIISSNVTFYSNDDTTFQDFVVKREGANAKKRTNIGWMVYVGMGKDKYSARAYSMAKNGLRKLPVSVICEFITNSSFYNSFK